MKKILHTLVGIIGTIVIIPVAIRLIMICFAFVMAIFSIRDVPSWFAPTAFCAAFICAILFAVKWFGKKTKKKVHAISHKTPDVPQASYSEAPQKPLNVELTAVPQKLIEAELVTVPQVPVEKELATTQEVIETEPVTAHQEPIEAEPVTAHQEPIEAEPVTAHQEPIEAEPVTVPLIAPAKPTTEKQSYVSKKYLPRKLEGHPIQYAYVYRFTPAEGINVKSDILGYSEKIVDIDSDGERIALSYNDIIFGFIENREKAAMVSDFKRKGLPCHAVLLSNGEEVNLRFYKDKRFGNEWREQTVCKLTACKSESKQETISLMEIGDEVDLEEDYDHDDSVIAYYEGDPIGKLPKKAALRFLQEEAYAAFLEKLEQDDEFRDIPHVRIYW